MNNPIMMNPHDKNLDFTESEADDDYDDRYITLSKFNYFLNIFHSCCSFRS